jgi:hypothetical protein
MAQAPVPRDSACESGLYSGNHCTRFSSGVNWYILHLANRTQAALHALREGLASLDPD